MKVDLLTAIGASPNMNASEIKAKWDAAPASITTQASSIATSIGAVLTLQQVVNNAISAVAAAQTALDAAMVLSTGGANMAVRAAEAAAGEVVDQFSDSQKTLVNQMKDTQVDV